MSAETIENKPEYERFNMFLDTWNKLKAAGNFVPSQEEADRLAAMFHVKAPKVAEHVRVRAIDLNDLPNDMRSFTDGGRLGF